MMDFGDFLKKGIIRPHLLYFEPGGRKPNAASQNPLSIWILVHFQTKKPTKNLSKTKSEPLQNRRQKHDVFQHRFFEVLDSILEPLGPPRWSRVGHFGAQTLLNKPS